MELLNYLKAHENWMEELQNAPYYLKISEDTIDGITYYLFKYNQLSSDMSIKLVQEARGCIFTLDKSKGWVCVSRPFDKFFNYGEANAAQIDWDNAYVTEKVDGSLIKVWWWNGWHVSTNGIIDANKAELNGNPNKSYFDLFEQALNYEAEEFWNVLNKDLAYRNVTMMFELVSPEARLVVSYNETKLYYLSSRNNVYGYYIDDIDLVEEMEYYTNIRIHLPKLYNLSSLEDCIEVANKFGKDKEGFVVGDANGNRIKIKGKEYLNAFQYRCNNLITTHKVLQMAREDILDDFLAYCPDWEWKVNEVVQNLVEIAQMYEAAYDSIVTKVEMGSITTRKEAAEEIKKLGDASPYCFYCVSKGEISGLDYLLEVMSDAKLLNTVRAYEKIKGEK